MTEIPEHFFEDVDTVKPHEHSGDAGPSRVYGEEVGVYSLGPDSETFQTAMEIEGQDYGFKSRLSAGVERNAARIVRKITPEMEDAPGTKEEAEGPISNYTATSSEAMGWGRAVDRTVEKMAEEDILPGGRLPFSYPDPEEDDRFNESLDRQFDDPSPTPSVVATEVYREELSDPFIAGVWSHASEWGGPWQEYCADRLND